MNNIRQTRMPEEFQFTNPITLDDTEEEEKINESRIEGKLPYKNTLRKDFDLQQDKLRKLEMEKLNATTREDVKYWKKQIKPEKLKLIKMQKQIDKRNKKWLSRGDFEYPFTKYLTFIRPPPENSPLDLYIKKPTPSENLIKQHMETSPLDLFNKKTPNGDLLRQKGMMGQL